MMFSSKTPRDLNRDPYPWLHDHHWACSDNGGRFTFNNGVGNVFDPRPEFDQSQHNKPNPILVAFRSAPPMPRQAHYWARAIAENAWSPVTATAEQVSHARRVLNRLAALEAS